jgi:hypothetical protein
VYAASQDTCQDFSWGAFRGEEGQWRRRDA